MWPSVRAPLRTPCRAPASVPGTGVLDGSWQVLDRPGHHESASTSHSPDCPTSSTWIFPLAPAHPVECIRSDHTDVEPSIPWDHAAFEFRCIGFEARRAWYPLPVV